MTDLSPALKMIQVEETKDQAAVSQATLSRFGQTNNFIATRHMTSHKWDLNGKYNIVAAPQIGVDGIIDYPFDFTLVDVEMMVGSANGSSGTTEVDIKWRPRNGATWLSIFSTTPKFTSAANPFDTISVGATLAAMTAPVLSKTTFNALDQLRLDIIQEVAGAPEGMFVKAYIKPR